MINKRLGLKNVNTIQTIIQYNTIQYKQYNTNNNCDVKENGTLSVMRSNCWMCPAFIQDFREKNTDHMRPDIVALLKSSKNAFICGLMGIDPVATFRWAVLRAYFRALVAFREAGRRHTHKKTGEQMSVNPIKLGGLQER